MSINLSLRDRRLTWFHGTRGFTLVEMMIVILIIAILVGIAIPVFLIVTRKAKESTAQANQRTGESAMNLLWNDYQGRNINDYSENFGPNNYLHFATIISKYQSKMNCLHIYGSDGSNILRTHYLFKNNVIIEGIGNQLPPRADGRVGFARMYRNGAVWRRNYTAGDAVTPGFEHITVINKVAGKTKTYFTTYKLGAIVDSGTFDWNLTTGATSNFQTN